MHLWPCKFLCVGLCSFNIDLHWRYDGISEQFFGSCSVLHFRYISLNIFCGAAYSEFPLFGLPMNQKWHSRWALMCLLVREFIKYNNQIHLYLLLELGNSFPVHFNNSAAHWLWPLIHFCNYGLCLYFRKGNAVLIRMKTWKSLFNTD